MTDESENTYEKARGQESPVSLKANNRDGPVVLVNKAFMGQVRTHDDGAQSGQLHMENRMGPETDPQMYRHSYISPLLLKVRGQKLSFPRNHAGKLGA